MATFNRVGNVSTDVAEHASFDRNSEYVTAETYNPDGNFDYYVDFVEVATQNQVSDVLVAGNPSDTGFSPSNNYVACSSSDVVEIIDVSDITSPSVVETLSQSTGATRGLSWSPDGKYLAYGYNDGTVAIHDNDPANGWPVVTTVRPTGDRARMVDFSYDSSMLAVGIGDAIYVYDTSDWSVLGKDTGLGTGQHDLCFSYDDTRVFGNYSDDSGTYVREFNVVTWTSTNRIATSGETLHDDPDGTAMLAARLAGNRERVRIFNRSDWSEVGTVSDANSDVQRARFSHDGSWLIVVAGNIHVYEVTTPSVSGTVVDTSGTAVGGASVWLIDDNTGEVRGFTTTASDGTYSFNVADTNIQYHVICQWTDSNGNEYYSRSKPYVTAV